MKRLKTIVEKHNTLNDKGMITVAVLATLGILSAIIQVALELGGK